MLYYICICTYYKVRERTGKDGCKLQKTMAYST